MGAILVTHCSTKHSRRVALCDHGVLRVTRAFGLGIACGTVGEAIAASGAAWPQRHTTCARHHCAGKGGPCLHLFRNLTRGTHAQLLRRGHRLYLYVVHSNGAHLLPAQPHALPEELGRGALVRVDGRTVRWASASAHPCAAWTDLHFAVEGLEDVSPPDTPRLAVAPDSNA